MCSQLKDLQRIYPGATREPLQQITKVLLNSSRPELGTSEFHLYEAKKVATRSSLGKNAEPHP